MSTDTTPTGSTLDPVEAVHGSAAPSVADDQHADANPPERPADAPYCWPFQKLPRRRRAEFMQALAPALDAEDEIDQLTYPEDHEKAGEPLPGKGGTYLALVTKLAADVEEAMVLVASDEKTMRTWARTADDNDLLALMRWYVGRFQVGEA